MWSVLNADFFQRYVPRTGAVLDLGCGYGEFINTIECASKFAMDLNPDAEKHLRPTVKFLRQDCLLPWNVPAGSLNVVFTSNFFEHLPDKQALGRTLDQVADALASGGRLIAMGPNIKHLTGAYWDFWDHYLPLTDMSLCEALRTRGFRIERSIAKFLPYTMASGPKYPLWILRAYLRLPLAWHVFGRQFLVVATKGE